MDRDQILLQIKQQIFASQLLSSREKWGMYSTIQKENYEMPQLQQILESLQKESQYIAQAEVSAQQQYAKDLAAWHENLADLMHTEVPKQMKNVEAADHAKDEAEADALLNELE